MCACVIHAFYIIIFIPHFIIWECYMHCYIDVLHVLDDLWDFHIKSLFLVFNTWEAPANRDTISPVGIVKVLEFYVVRLNTLVIF